MNAQDTLIDTLDSRPLPVQAKLAAAWTSFMFLYIYVSMFNAVGESWTYFYGLSIGLEVLLLAFILRAAWTWPRAASPTTSSGQGADRMQHA